MDKEHPNHTPMKANKNPAVKHALPPRGLNNARPAPAKLLAEIRSHLCSNCAIASTPDLPTSQCRSPQLLLERPNQPAKRESPGLALTPFALSAYSDDPATPAHPTHPSAVADVRGSATGYANTNCIRYLPNRLHLLRRTHFFGK